MKDSKEDKQENEIQMKQIFGLPTSISLIIGAVIGSGIFISPTGITAEMGSVGGSLIIWVACGLFTLLDNHMDAELGATYREAGGMYTYLKKAYGKSMAMVFLWVTFFGTGPAGMATQTLVCSEYLLSLTFTDGCAPPWILRKTLAIFLLSLTYGVNMFSSRVTKWTTVMATVGKVSGVITIIIGGMYYIAKGNTENFQNSFEGTNWGASAIAVAFYNGLWAYGGAGIINGVREEVIKPTKTIPRALTVALPCVICVYLAANCSYFSAMTAEELIATPVVAVAWAEKVIPGYGWTMSLTVAISTFGTATQSSMLDGRVPFVSSRDGNMPEMMSMIHIRRKTPLPALFLAMIMAMVMVIPGEVRSLIGILGFSGWFFGIAKGVGLIICRLRYKDLPRPYKVPLIVPAVYSLFGVYLFSVPLILAENRLPYVYALIFIAFGGVIYVVFGKFQFVMPGTESLTVFLQLLVQITPSQDEITKDKAERKARKKNKIERNGSVIAEKPKIELEFTTL